MSLQHDNDKASRSFRKRHILVPACVLLPVAGAYGFYVFANAPSRCGTRIKWQYCFKGTGYPRIFRRIGSMIINTPSRIALLTATLMCCLSPQEAFATDASISVSGFSFVGPNVTIDVGDKVTWSGLAAIHNVAQSDSAASNAYNLTGFRSGDVGDVTTFDHTFATPGIFYYICEPHAASDDMKGSVTVNALSVPASEFFGLALLVVLLAAACFGALHRLSNRAA